MNKSILLFGAPLGLLAACHSTTNKTFQTVTSDSFPSTAFISLDSANRMIGSYVQSLASDTQPSDLYSISFDAAKLREYLSDTSITALKMSMAHSLAFINGNGYGHAAGYRSDALTLVISAFTATGQFVFHDNQVMNLGAQCPTVCPPGQAASNLFPTTNASHD